MIAECHITCGSWGQGLAAFDQLSQMLEKAIWIGVVLFVAWLLLRIILR